MPQFTTQSAADAARKSHSETSARDESLRFPSTLVQAVQLQRALHKVGMAVAQNVSADTDIESRARLGSSLASIAKGWDSLAARVQILRGRAAPGTLSPAERRAKLEAKRTKPRHDGPTVASKPDAT